MRKKNTSGKVAAKMGSSKNKPKTKTKGTVRFISPNISHYKVVLDQRGAPNLTKTEIDTLYSEARTELVWMKILAMTSPEGGLTTRYIYDADQRVVGSANISKEYRDLTFNTLDSRSNRTRTGTRTTRKK